MMNFETLLGWANLRWKQAVVALALSAVSLMAGGTAYFLGNHVDGSAGIVGAVVFLMISHAALQDGRNYLMAAGLALYGEGRKP